MLFRSLAIQQSAEAKVLVEYVIRHKSLKGNRAQIGNILGDSQKTRGRAIAVVELSSTFARSHFKNVIYGNRK